MPRLVLAAALLAAGCSHGPEPEDPQTLTVLLQVCVPGQVVRFKDLEVDLRGAPPAREFDEEVRSILQVEAQPRSRPPVGVKDPGDRDVARQWIPGSGPGEVERPALRFGEVMNRGGVVSEGIGGIRLMGSTLKDQPVFEMRGDPPGNYLALSIRLPVSRKGSQDYVTYWFRLPPAISETGFSDWIAPVSEEDRAIQERQKLSTGWSLMDGKPMEVHKVGPGAPKMRVKLVTLRDYANLNRFWERTRDALVQKYYVGAPPGPQRDRLLFAPKRDEAVPAC